MLDTLRLAIVDVETTGTSVTGDRIIEVAVQRIEEGRPVRTFSSLIDPETRVPDWIERLTGISNTDLEGAPSFASIADELAGVLDGCVFVAHNVRFDYGFIRNEFSRLGRAFTAPCLCTVRLSRALYPRFRRHGLSELIDRFSLACPNRHRALDDTLAVWAFLEQVRRSFDSARLAQAVRPLLRTPTLPPHLPQAALGRLPDGPGAYVFYDESGTPLYVGKSRKVRSRILAHFSDDHRSGREMRLCQHTARIEAHDTYGELGALLLESQLIKSLTPLYNRIGRAHQWLVVARRVLGDSGYARIELERMDAGRSRQDGVLGVFRSVRQARAIVGTIAREHALCPRALGLERSHGSCIYRQIRLCRGACTGAEPPAAFNERLDAAFANRRVKTWPFPGAILIEEPGPNRSEGHLFILSDWRLVLAARYGEEGLTRFLEPPTGFDHDIYKILAAHIIRHSTRVRQLSEEDVDRLTSDLR
jgi:DNA polymerase-3 subunit epsilon